MGMATFLNDRSPTMPQRLARSAAWPGLGPGAAAAVAGAWTLVLLVVAVCAHPTPLYGVETDLVGEYLPAARELLRGSLGLAHYAYKGPGYPLLLALFAVPFGGDVALAARVLAPLATGVAAWLAWRLTRAAAGDAVAAFTLAALLACPATVRYAIEAGTDAPALALMLGATWLTCTGGGARRAAAAGALAALAVLTRGNAVFLALGAACVLSRRGWRPALAWAIAFAAPLVAWQAIARAAGGLPADRNYLNVAWELYGRGVRWETFETTAGARFHSMLDVVRYDPFGAGSRIVTNFVAYRAHDLAQLVPVWLGLVAAPGAVLLARRAAARPWLAHAVACAVVLAPVFYNARFALYLAPVYLACAGATLEWVAQRVPRAWPRLVTAVAASLVVASAAVAVVTTTDALRAAPDEVRMAGRALAARGATGAIAARKPHVAWFAGMAAVPFPSGVPLPRLAAAARTAGATHLFYSGIEQMQRPEYGVLADSGVALPGFVPELWGRTANGHDYAVYRVAPVRVDSAAFAAAWRAALERYEARRAGTGDAALFVAAQYLELGDPAAALARLDGLVLAGAHDPAVDRYRGTALIALERWDEAAAACVTTLRDGAPTGADWDRLGGVRAVQGRWRDAVDAFTSAIALEPANAAYLEHLGRAAIEARDFAAAAAAFERRVRLDPRDVASRRMAIGAWQLAGNTARARELYAAGVAGGAAAAQLDGGR